MKTFTACQREYEIKPCDFILNNGFDIRFVAGDGRTIKQHRFDADSSVTLMKKDLKQFVLSDSNCEIVTIDGNKCKKYSIIKVD